MHKLMRRFIPTPVGNTAGLRMVIAAQAVHPHARGEHVETAKRAVRQFGSSPRPWGTPCRQPE